MKRFLLAAVLLLCLGPFAGAKDRKMEKDIEKTLSDRKSVV